MKIKLGTILGSVILISAGLIVIEKFKIDKMLHANSFIEEQVQNVSNLVDNNKDILSSVKLDKVGEAVSSVGNNVTEMFEQVDFNKVGNLIIEKKDALLEFTGEKINGLEKLIEIPMKEIQKNI
ncbi:hypothetical protein [Romboutsia lituseburensis]|uniref:hypothetical protein n=1 Tax=Romboutsia lituseburensis TaxID=1537 RepID=UPI00215A754E|nr:hypothetical protein [Romboutsia lituseburensis]MCR8745487.1 hypothetical protein [Romboutsia lituseburensis]